MELTLEKRPEAGVPPDLDPFLRPGESGHFAGEWLAYPYDGGQRSESAYAGTLIGRWNGSAVWSCTWDVAAAVVTDQECARRHWRGVYEAGGMTEPKLSRALDGDVRPMWWDGDVILADRTEAGDGLMTIEPDERGLYVVMGRIWTWEEVPVDAADACMGDGQTVAA